jgi:hypothetical protein
LIMAHYRGNPKHGLFGSPLYNIWRNIRRRCLHPNDAKYPDYGGRGITICARWDDFAAFNADMWPRPSPKHTVERIDNSKGYSPDNCRWATMAEQQANRRDTVNVTYEGRTQCVMHWAREFGVDRSMLARRLARGVPMEQALSKGRLYRKELTLDGRTQSLIEWSRELAINEGTLWGRVLKGWTDKDALTLPVKARPCRAERERVEK